MASRHPVLVVAHGGNPRGADFLAGHWARRQRAAGRPVTEEARPADWGAPCRPECRPGHRRRRGRGPEYCPAAGNYRNQELLVDRGAGGCLAFFQAGAPNRGTSDCVRRAVTAGIPVWPLGAVPPAIAALLGQVRRETAGGPAAAP